MNTYDDIIENVYEIVKVEGFGLYECPYTYSPTGLLYKDKYKAHEEANKLWLKNTTEKERNDVWCPLSYTVTERKLL